MITNQPTHRLKVINSFKLSQWIYNNFASLIDKQKSREMLFMGIIAFLYGTFNGSIAYTEGLIFYSYGCDSLRYLICYSSLPWDAFSISYNKMMIKMSQKLSRELDVAIGLVIDDTLVNKDNRSKNLAVGGKKQNKVGFSLLTSVLVIGPITIPLVPQLCFRQSVCERWGINYVPKTKKAMERVQWLIESGLDIKNLVLIMDSWYSSNEMLNYCQSVPHLKYVLGIKSNRNLDKRPVKKLKHGFRYVKSKLLSKKDHNFYLSLRSGKLNGVKDKVNVLISKRENKISKMISWRYFASNLNGEKTVLEWVNKRWHVETFHQIFKHHFNPGNWRVHGIERLTNMLILSTMSMGFAFKYFLDNGNVQINSLERYMEHNIISESLNFTSASLISNEVDIKSYIQSRL